MSETASRQPLLLPEVSSAYLSQTLSQHPPSPICWIAYSGGLDSRVLLAIAATLAAEEAGRQFRAVHVHHGLHQDADAWTWHCRETCESLGIPLTVLTVDAAKRPGESPEESARMARYQAMAATIGPGDAVLLAQHRDDQAETLLLQLFRGAGLNGLAAMPARAEFGSGTLLRPFLDLTRADLHHYATQHQLTWVEDSSNADPAFDRNFLRQRVLPLLQTRWPSLGHTLARSARHCAEASNLLQDEARTLLNGLLRPDGAISSNRLASLDSNRQKLALREWIRMAGYRLPSAAIIERILKEGLGAGADRNPQVRWKEAEVRRYRAALHLLPVLDSIDAESLTEWPQGKDTLPLNGNGSITRMPRRIDGLCRERWERARVQIRYRAGGESLRLPGRQGTHELRKLFQEAGIPPWVRDRIPLIYLDGQLASVGGLWSSADFAPAKPESPCIRLEWTLPAGLRPLPLRLPKTDCGG